MKKTYVQYGCGLSAPAEWRNYDASPTLRIQKTPLLGDLLKGRLNTVFPENVLYGDIIKGLPEFNNSCDGVYCSHTLEHLSLEDFKIALANTYKILKPGGIFRCIVPDLELAARTYLQQLDEGRKDASIGFMNNTLLGLKQRPRGAKQQAEALLGNAHHLWMWDRHSLSQALEQAGFHSIRTCQFNDCEDPMFHLVEDKDRFNEAVALECKK